MNVNDVLGKFWKDVKRGKDIDVFFALSLVAAFFITSGAEQFGYIAPERAGDIAQKLMVALFGTMAFISLQARHVYSDIKDKIYKNNHLFTDSFAVNILDEIQTAKTVTVVANTLDLPELDGFASVFERALVHGVELNVLLVNPQHVAADIAAQRGAYEEPEPFKQRIIDNLRVLRMINEKSLNKISVKVIDNPLSYFAIKFTTSEKSRKHNTICVAHYPFKTEQVREPKHTLRDGYDSYHAVFASEITNLWNAGSKWA